MKNKAVLFGMAALLMTSATFAQSVENDDMYFNSKDRVKLKTKQAQDEVAYQTALTGDYGKKNQNVQYEDVNPTDTYSARNENPEYAARNNSQTATSDNQDYFVSDYRYNNSTKLNSWNNNFNSWYGSPWVASNYYSPSIYGWNSPYYGSAYDAFGNPWMNPYYRSGWSSSFSFYMGNSWNYGWGSGYGMGMGMAYGSPFMNSMYGWGSPYSSFGFGSAFGYGYGGLGGYYGGGYYGGYGNNVVIINNGTDGGRNIAYGQRATRGGMVTSRPESVNSRTRNSSFTDNGNVRPSSMPSRDGSTTGRMPTNSNVSSGRNQQPQADYYNRSWRNSQQTTGAGSSYSAPQRGSWSQPSNGDSWNRGGNSNSSFNNSSFNTGRSSGSFDGGGARSHSSMGGGGGSGGRSRGRD